MKLIMRHAFDDTIARSRFAGRPVHLVQAVQKFKSFKRSFGEVDDHVFTFEPVTELAAAAMGFEYLLKILRDFLVTLREGQIEG